MKVRHILIDDPKFGDKTKYFYNQIGQLGYNYETIADFATSASLYERMFVLYPDEREKVGEADGSDDAVAAMDTQAADAIFSAAVFRRAEGDPDQAIANYRSFLERFPDDPRVDDVKVTIGKIYEEQARWTDAANEFQAFYTAADETTAPEFVYYARLHHGKALYELGQDAKAVDVYKKSVAAYKRYVEAGGEPGDHTEFAAEMMFVLAKPTFDRFVAMEIRGCGCTSQSREDKALLEVAAGQGQGAQGGRGRLRRDHRDEGR